MLVLPARPVVLVRQHQSQCRGAVRAAGLSHRRIYGYTHSFGGYAGAHAQFVRVPHADVDCFSVPDGVRDEQAVFLSDAAPAGYMGAEYCNIHPGDIVAVWGCGGVGLMAQKSAYLLGTARVIGIDRLPVRRQLFHPGVSPEF